MTLWNQVIHPKKMFLILNIILIYKNIYLKTIFFKILF